MGGVGDHVRVVVRTHPFRQDRSEVLVPSGFAVPKLLELAGLNPEFAGAVHVDGRRLKRADWATTAPDAGALVTSYAVPQGGGGKQPRSGLEWFLAVFPPTAPLYQAYARVRWLRETYTAIFSTPKVPGLDGFGNSRQLKPFITGTRNDVRPYGTVPYVLGYRVRYRPPYAARPYSSWKGNRQRFHALMTFGHGPVRLENLKFGDTPIAALGLTLLAHGQTQATNAGASIQVREGWNDDDAIAYYLTQVSEEALSIDLNHSKPDGTRSDWAYRRTDPGVDKIGVEVNFPQGLITFDSQNNPQKLLVEVEVEYAPAGTSPTSLTGWIPAVGKDDQNRTNSYSGIKVNDAKRSAFSVGIDWVPAAGNGQYDVRLRRKTQDRNKLTQLDTVVWSTLENYRLGSPIRLSGLCTVSLDVVATGALTGELDSFNAEASFMGPYWDAFGGSWVTPTRSSTPSLWKSAQPAAHVRAILTGSANRAPLDISRVDLTTLATWATATQQAGLFFNGVIDSPGTTRERLDAVTSMGRASFAWRDGKASVVADITAPGSHQQVFTPREYDEFLEELAFDDEVHALRVQYSENAVEGALAETIVYDDGYNKDGTGGKTAATKFEAVTYLYCRDKTEAWKHGRRALAERRLRRSRFSFTCTDVHANTTRGDLVLAGIEHIDTVLAWGRVKSVTLNGSGDAVSVQLDESLTIDSAKSYLFRFRKSSNVYVVRAITTPGSSGEYTTLTFAVAIPAASPQPMAGDLFIFGESTTNFRRCLIYSIEHRADLGARVMLIDEAPGVYTADTSTASTATTSTTSAAPASVSGASGVLRVAVAPPTGPGKSTAGIVVSVSSSGRSGTTPGGVA